MIRVDRLSTFVWVLAPAIVSPAWPAPVVHMTEATEVRVIARPVLAGLVEAGKEPRLVVAGASEARGEMLLDWPPGRGPTRVALTARAAEPSVDGEQVLDVRAELTLADGSVVQALRTLRFAERTTALFEVYRTGEDTLTLALEAEAEIVRRYTARPVPGAAVRFHLEIERVIDGRTVLLETNDLDTFVSEPVTYSFRLGDRPESERGRLTLRPLRVVGDVVEVEAELGGAVVSEGNLAMVGRTERILASRETATTLALESGTPPVGYRFRITPRF